MNELTITLPLQSDKSYKDAEAELRIEIATHLYAQRLLAFGKARELAGLDTVGFFQELGKREIEYDYDVDDLDEDIATLKRLKLRGTP